MFTDESSRFDMLGWLLPQSGYNPTSIVEAIESGGVVLFSCADKMDPECATILLSLMIAGEADLPQRQDNPTLRLHPDTVLIFDGPVDTHNLGVSFINKLTHIV
jgi:hypothetical protein